MDTNALQNRCYMCIQLTHVLYSLEITQQSNPPISPDCVMISWVSGQCLCTIAHWVNLSKS